MSLSIRQWLADRQIQLNALLTPGAEVSGVAFRIIQDMEVKSLTPFDICSVVDVLELPLAASIRIARPVAQLTVGLLRLLSRKKPLKRSEGTWLTFQVAYLQALQALLEQEARLKRPWLDRASVPVEEDADQPFSDPKLQGILKTLRPGRLSDSQAEQALTRMGDSFLVQQMNNLAIAWLIANGAEETEAHLLARRLVNSLPGHLLAVIAENATPLAQLQKFVRLGNPRSLEDISRETQEPEIVEEVAIDLKRERYRAQLLADLGEPLLSATFSLKDIYVPLKGLPVEDYLAVKSAEMSGDQTLPAPPSQPVDLHDWAIAQLEDRSSIAAIEAESGWGKTSFCKIFAAQIARKVYPEWMPVLIRLRDATLGQTFEQTLESAFPQGRFTDADGWLCDKNPPLLLILDGLDELPPSPQKLRHHIVFIDQLMQFHAQCLSNQPPLKHKIILTSRFRTLDSLTRKYRVGSIFPLQTKLQRIVIQPMDQEGLRQWFTQWSKLQSKSISVRYFTFLKEEGLFRRTCPKAIAHLVYQPLMLYLLGILHRDGLIDKSLLEMNRFQVKFEIYERITRWLLGETQGRKLLPEGVREGMAHANRGSEAIANLLAGRQPQQTRDFMQQLALQILQASNGKLEIFPDSAIRSNILLHNANPSLPALFFDQIIRSQKWAAQTASNWQQARSSGRSRPEVGNWGLERRDAISRPHLMQESPHSEPEDAQPPATPQKHECGSIQVTFSHPSLGAYLGAVAIAKRLSALTEQTQDRYGEVFFTIDSPEAVAQHLYELLGYGILSPEMEELLIEYLRRREQRNAKVFSFPLLFNRLYRFYRIYSQSCWLDRGIAHQAHARLQALNNSFNVLQVDAAVGLNVFLLLCAIARTASIPFWPCGDPNLPQEFDPDRFSTFIARLAVLSPTCFFTRVRNSLSQLQLAGACLNQAMLPEVNLSLANLAIAELNRANLVAANLSQANLSWASLAAANLQHSNLSQANLEGADLSGANLLGANLSLANLNNTCLFQTQLDEENRKLARHKGAFFSWEEFQEYSQSLGSNLQLGDLPDAEFFDTDSKIHIEVAEGEPILPNAWDDDDSESESTLPLAESDLETSDLPQDPNSERDNATLVAPEMTAPIQTAKEKINSADSDETWVAGPHSS